MSDIDSFELPELEKLELPKLSIVTNQDGHCTFSLDGNNLECMLSAKLDFLAGEENKLTLEMDVSADIDGIPVGVKYLQSADDIAGARIEGPTVSWGEDAPDQKTLFERIDELTWSDCATCRVWRASILIGFTIALTIDIGLRLWT